jgi:phosphonate transport system ATP-binding protein
VNAVTSSPPTDIGSPEREVASQPVLDIRQLSKRYGDGPLVLDSVSLAAGPGELVAVLGANGSGKSTMLRCAVRLTDPTKGSVRVAGRDIAELSGRALREARRAVAMVFQRGHLVGRRSAAANVASGALGRHHGIGCAAGRLPGQELREAFVQLERVGLAHLAWRRADGLSGGEAQRVAIARALSQRPRALLADEPVASLDPDATGTVMELLRDLARRERLAVVCVLHQPELALRFADRVVGLREGQLRFDRPVADVGPEMIASLYAAASAG